jgi:hypothetical protein
MNGLWNKPSQKSFIVGSGSFSSIQLNGTVLLFYRAQEQTCTSATYMNQIPSQGS